MKFKPTFKTTKKKCEYEGCNEEFKGIATGKYCPEHRKQKYRKFIDKEKIRKKKELKDATNPNQIIKHSYKTSIIIQGKCQLEGCGKDFEILVIPLTYTYPRYCEDHRNEFKRELFLKNNR